MRNIFSSYVNKFLKKALPPTIAEDLGQKLSNELFKKPKDQDQVKIVNLIKKGAALHIPENCDDRDGYLHAQPLGWAAYHGQADIVELLIENGANVNAVDEFEWTPLMRAARYGHRDVLNILLSADADILMLDNVHMSARQHAREEGHFDIVTLLEDIQTGRKPRPKYFEEKKKKKLLQAAKSTAEGLKKPVKVKKFKGFKK